MKPTHRQFKITCEIGDFLYNIYDTNMDLIKTKLKQLIVEVLRH